MTNRWQQFGSTLFAATLAALTGCTGGVLPSSPTEPRVQDLFSLLRPNNDAEEVDQITASQEDCLLPGDPSDATHEDLFNALNDYRAKHGLTTLIYSQTLEEAANAHLQDMYERDYFAHLTPEGLTPGDRAIAVGFCHSYVGENLAAGQRNVKAAMRAWDRSPSHQLNMLEVNYVYVGVGHFVDPITGRQYWAQEFAYQLQ